MLNAGEKGIWLPFALNGILLGRMQHLGIPSGKWGEMVAHLPNITAECQNPGPCVARRIIG
jgi:hypothetical protein